MSLELAPTNADCIAAVLQHYKLSRELIESLMELREAEYSQLLKAVSLMVSHRRRMDGEKPVDFDKVKELLKSKKIDELLKCAAVAGIVNPIHIHPDAPLHAITGLKGTVTVKTTQIGDKELPCIYKAHQGHVLMVATLEELKGTIDIDQFVERVTKYAEKARLGAALLMDRTTLRHLNIFLPFVAVDPMEKDVAMKVDRDFAADQGLMRFLPNLPVNAEYDSRKVALELLEKHLTASNLDAFVDRINKLRLQLPHDGHLVNLIAARLQQMDIKLPLKYGTVPVLGKDGKPLKDRDGKIQQKPFDFPELEKPDNQYKIVTQKPEAGGMQMVVNALSKISEVDSENTQLIYTLMRSFQVHTQNDLWVAFYKNKCNVGKKALTALYKAELAIERKLTHIVTDDSEEASTLASFMRVKKSKEYSEEERKMPEEEQKKLMTPRFKVFLVGANAQSSDVNVTSWYEVASNVGLFSKLTMVGEGDKAQPARRYRLLVCVPPAMAHATFAEKDLGPTANSEVVMCFPNIGDLLQNAGTTIGPFCQRHVVKDVGIMHWQLRTSVWIAFSEKPNPYLATANVTLFHKLIQTCNARARNMFSDFMYWNLAGGCTMRREKKPIKNSEGKITGYEVNVKTNRYVMQLVAQPYPFPYSPPEFKEMEDEFTKLVASPGRFGKVVATSMMKISDTDGRDVATPLVIADNDFEDYVEDGEEFVADKEEEPSVTATVKDAPLVDYDGDAVMSPVEVSEPVGRSAKRAAVDSADDPT
jgi:hypothetical protein